MKKYYYAAEIYNEHGEQVDKYASELSVPMRRNDVWAERMAAYDCALSKTTARHMQRNRGEMPPLITLHLISSEAEGSDPFWLGEAGELPTILAGCETARLSRNL